MKRVTLRHFLANVRAFPDVVEVSIQPKGSGEITVLGTWYPLGTQPGRGGPTPGFEQRALAADIPPVDTPLLRKFGRPKPAPK